MKRLLVNIGAILFLHVITMGDATAQSLSYTVTNLVGLGGSTSSAVAINNFGQVAGYSLIPGDTNTHAFLFSNGTITDITPALPTGSVATSINNNGEVVGTYGSPQGGFLYKNRTLYDLGTLGATFGGTGSETHGINDSGQVVGFAAVSGAYNVPRHAFLFSISNGTMQDLGLLSGTNSDATAINNATPPQITGASDALGATATHAFLYSSPPMADLDPSNSRAGTAGQAINNKGEVVGWVGVNGEPHAALIEGVGNIKDLGTLGNVMSFALGINDNGDIVGHSCASCSNGTTPYGDSTRHAFLYHSGVMYDLNNLVTTSGWTIYDASGINNSGQIAGTGVLNGRYYAIRLDPPGLADFSLSSISPITVGLGGSATSPVTVNSFSGFNSPVTLGVSTPPGGVSASFSPSSVTPPAGGTASSTLTMSLGPSVTPSTFTLTVTGTSGSLTHSTAANVTVTTNSSSIANVIGQLLNGGCIDNSGIGTALTSKLSAAQTQINAGDLQGAINTLTALINQLQAQSGKHIATSCVIGGVTFNSGNALIMDVQSLIDSLRVATIADPITGYVVNSSGAGVQGATVSILAGSNVVLSATTDITGFYYFSTTGMLTVGATYAIQVTGFPTGYTTSTSASQAFSWGSSALTFNFSLN